MRQVTGNSALARARDSVALAAVLGFALAGCTGGEDTSAANPAAVTINTPAQIAQVSSDDYNDNVNGLITGQTLQHWIDDWENNKPAGVNGRLIILQFANFSEPQNTPEDPAFIPPEDRLYITPKPLEGVLSYQVDSNRLTQVRSNGVIETVQMVPDGNQVDAFLRDYAIDPRNDMVVCAMNRGNFSTAMTQGRCWYMFRYWGTPKTNLAILNGVASQSVVMDQNYLSSNVTCDEVLNGTSCLPRNGRVSVRDLPEDNTSMLASIEDVIDVVEGRKDAFVWDARTANEYTAVQELAPPSGKYLGIDFRNSAPMQGHPEGAVLLPYGNLLTDGTTLRYKPKADILAYMNGELVDGAQFTRYDAGSLIPLGVGGAYRPGQTVITYCETTFRAMITGFASAAILGLPNRFYDGAMVEWNSLAGGVQDKFGSFILPADSPWRTDIQSRSNWEYNTPSAIDSRTIDDPYASRTNAVTAADRAYRLGVGGNGGNGGGGVAPPANPCGG
ncbi:sulfurtransferase [Thioalkalivibrio sulfidiphilus]|uniref:sulfurtransferase n=1 Tax=Thioalkalivibrio sulfidiphilus TaxID=1033854 RepID=UPI003B37BD0E